MQGYSCYYFIVCTVVEKLFEVKVIGVIEWARKFQI